jgi:hypothetical protein
MGLRLVIRSRRAGNDVQSPVTARFLCLLFEGYIVPASIYQKRGTNYEVLADWLVLQRSIENHIWDLELHVEAKFQ